MRSGQVAPRKVLSAEMSIVQYCSPLLKKRATEDRTDVFPLSVSTRGRTASRVGLETTWHAVLLSFILPFLSKASERSAPSPPKQLTSRALNQQSKQARKRASKQASQPAWSSHPWSSSSLLWAFRLFALSVDAFVRL